MIWYDEDKNNTTNINFYFSELKNSIMKKIRKADIHKKWIKYRNDDFYI